MSKRMSDWEAFARADRVEGPHGSIQWKGTEVCMDVRCACGYHSHIDGEFLYYIQCPNCGQVYRTGMSVKLHAVDAAPNDFVVYVADL